MCLAPGLVMFSTVNILARAFYALGDTRTPMQISILCLTINFIAACLLIVPLREGGPGIANTFTSLINVALLFIALRKKLGETGDGVRAVVFLCPCYGWRCSRV